MGKIIFLDLRDMSGKVQAVAIPSHEEAYGVANTLRGEWVVAVTGKANKRPEKMVAVPGWSQGLMLNFLHRMGVVNKDASTNLPFGDPNVLKETMSRPIKGSGLQSTNHFSEDLLLTKG